MKNIIIIGGGPSGLISAIYATKKGNKITLLEKNNTLGKKLLLTGNGKCNYWNEDQSLKHYNSTNRELIKKIINEDNQKEIQKFFNNIGIIPKIKERYYYPYSNQATSIQNSLIKECELNKVNIITNCEVKDIEKENNSFKILTTKGTLIADKIIIATGSLAFPKTGSTGDGYRLAKKYGHNIITPLPALVQLKANETYLKEWHGIRADVSITLVEDNKQVKKEIGEIQLTNYGISGICVFNISSLVSRGLNNNKKEQVKINFLYPFNINTKDEFITFMNQRNNHIKNRTISDLLDGLMNYKLVNLILKLSQINKETNWNNVPESKKIVLGNNLTNFTLNITGTNSFDSSQTCTGGIPLTEINLATMESLIMKDIYFAGEIIDVDGECGGYNLTNAWITGMLAGKGVNNDEN